MKKTIFICALISLLLLGCQQNDQSIIYKSDAVEVKKLLNTETNIRTHTEWAYIDEEMVYKNNGLIISGEIVSIQEAIIEYNRNEEIYTENITIFELNIDDVLYQKDGAVKQGDSLRLGYGFNSNNYSADLPAIDVGKEVIAFCYSTSTSYPHPLELSEYIDYWIGWPRDLLIEKADNSYIITSLFARSAEEAVQISSYLNINKDNAKEIADAGSIEEAIRAVCLANPSSTRDVVEALRDRCNSDSAEMWRQTTNNYIIEDDQLEKLIAATAKQYNGG